MPIEKRSEIENRMPAQENKPIREPITLKQNIALTLKLLTGGAALILLLWCVDGFLSN